MELNKTIAAHYKDNFDYFCQRITRPAGSVDNAQDVVQEAYTRALTYQKSYNPELGSFDQWFGRILSRALKDFKADERACGTTVGEEMIDEEYYTKEEALEDTVQIEQVAKVIAGKKEFHREVLTMYFLQQYNTNDIMRVLDVKKRCVDKIIERFRNEIGRYIKRA